MRRDLYSGPTRTYGFDGTIHGTEHLDVEVDAAGKVVAVWFRCQYLPFRQSAADSQRAADMTSMYGSGQTPRLHGVILEDELPART